MKRSFPPIEDDKITMLILGTMPGEKSLAHQQYYAHPQNRFWRVIAKITNRQLPDKYDQRTAMLSEAGIGLWDIIHNAEREGSLDSNIKNEYPNDLDKFIKTHPFLKAIAFNGKGAERLYTKYFTKKPSIRYISLPSTSPANAVFTFEKLYKEWNAALTVYISAR